MKQSQLPMGEINVNRQCQFGPLLLPRTPATRSEVSRNFEDCCFYVIVGIFTGLFLVSTLVH